MNQPGYTLIVCEKPDAARKVADALAEGEVARTSTGGIEVLEFQREGRAYVVCSALGHLYRISDSFAGRETFPVFDLEWYPANVVEKKKNLRGVQTRISLIKRLAKDAKHFINACDYDTEGETIGDNILRYACGGKESMALRAKFSTLTKDELILSFNEAKLGSGRELARSGRTRHVLDFIWGINLSRALSTATNEVMSSRYRTISMGRVQGPTLAFVVQREIAIRRFVPKPYWTILGLFESQDGTRFSAPSVKGKFERKAEAETVKNACQGQKGIVSEVTRSVFGEAPPPPFNTGDLQKEAYKAFGYPPSRTLQIAERLYLDALISYPRTSSQKLPQSIGYSRILSRLAGLDEYQTFARELIGRPLTPREGEKTDRAHPAIYPTGDHPRRALSSQETRILDLVVRRFLACFADNAIRERVGLKIAVNGNEFALSGRTTIRRGWLKYYGKYMGAEDRAIPKVHEHDELRVVQVDCDEKLELPPTRYNQSTLLERMEREGIGTKATRAEIIATLVTRGYVVGTDQLSATELGISVLETMEKYCPKIVSVELTRETEENLDEIEGGRSNGTEIIERVITVLSKQIEHIKANEASVGAEIAGAAGRGAFLDAIGKCPVCRTGNLVVIRSRKSGKRFVGCTNYSSGGCKASAPLPQRGSIKVAPKPCAKCGWPVVYVRRGRFPWRLCINIACDTKTGIKNSVQTLQKTS